MNTPATAAGMTKTRARTLARIARTKYPHLRTSARTIELVCPLDVGGDRLAHHITVWHQPWETPTAAAIDAAFVEHYTTEYDDERCCHVPAHQLRRGGAA